MASLRQKALARLQLGSICFKNALILKEDIWSKTSLVLEFLAIKLSEYFTILRDTLVRTIILPQLKLASVKMRGKQRGLGE